MATMASSTTPLRNKSKMIPRSSRHNPTIGGKSKGGSNGSILNFFKKSDPSPSTDWSSKEEEEESLFLEDSPTKGKSTVLIQTPTPPRDDEHPTNPSDRHAFASTNHADRRFNEDSEPAKRRRIGSPIQIPSSPCSKDKARSKSGPFFEDSDSEGEIAKDPVKSTKARIKEWENISSTTYDTVVDEESPKEEMESEESPLVPPLRRENTSVVEKDEFDGIEDFIDDEFPEGGEEFLERQWMEEQRDLETGLEDDESLIQDDTPDMGAKGKVQDLQADVCPICSGSFAGLTGQVCKSRALN